MPDRQGLDLDRGERLHYRGQLRFGGEVAVTDRRVLVDDDEEATSVRYTGITEITNEAFDWFLGLLSVALIGFGVLSIEQNVVVGVVFVVVGIWSVYRTYRHRNRVRIHTESRAKPVELFPEDVERLYAELEPAVETVRAEADDATER